MKKVMVIGSINMDFVVEVDRFPKSGETILAKGNYQIPGGKGANQAVAISRNNVKVSMFGKIGDDEVGRGVLDIMRREHVDVSMIQCLNGVNSGAAIIYINAEGENTIVVLPGANDVWTETDDELKAALQGHDIVVLQMEIPAEVTARILEIAKGMGIYTVFNCAPANLSILPYLRYVDLLLVNEIELSLLSGLEVIEEQDVLKGMEKLSSYCDSIIVTLGEKGCSVKDGKKIKSLPAHRVKVADTTAAGDAFVGGVVTKISEGMDLFAAAEFATAVSALTVTKIGAQSSIPSRGEVDCYIESLKGKRIEGGE